MKRTILQILPNLDYGGVERGTVEVANMLINEGFNSIVVSGSGRLVPELLAGGSKHIELPVGKKSLLSFRLIPALRKVFIENKVDIVHARSRLPAWLSHLALKKIQGPTKPCFVTTVHGPYSVNSYSKIMTKGDRIIAISNYIKNYIIENYPGVKKENITVIHRGVDRNIFTYGLQPTQEWSEKWYRDGVPSEKFLITLPARITRWKGQNDFIEIVAKLKKSGLNIHGLFVGGINVKKKRYLDKLQNTIDRLGMKDNFTFLGHRDDIEEIMAKSDIILSLANIPEAFGRTALEALSIGTPVIAYDHGGASEVLAKIFPEGKVAPLDTDATVLLIKKFYASMPNVKKNNSFSLNEMLEKTLETYASLCYKRK